MTTLLQNATRQMREEFDNDPLAYTIWMQLFDNVPPTYRTEEDNSLVQLRKSDYWPQACCYALDVWGTKPQKWQTDLGLYIAQYAVFSDNKTISISTASKILGVSASTVSTLIRRKTLPAISNRPILSSVLTRLREQPKAGRPRKNSAKEKTNRVKPILKWAGGKTQMLDILTEHMPRQYNKYIEPFIGGGALFFALQPQNAVISDSNPELVNLYTQIRDDVEGVIKALSRYRNDKDLFLETRALDWQTLDPVEAAARMIFLNKTCFNGLYRVNRKGQFNTPFGNYAHPTICDGDALRAASQVLQTTTIVCGDYRDVLRQYAAPNDFVFLDPPYIPVSEYADFKRYTKEQFSIDNQMELALEFMRLHAIGCHAMLTNSDHPLVYKLYGQYSITVHDTKRSVSCKSSSRSGKDTLVCSSPEPRLLTSVSKKEDTGIDAAEQTSMYPDTRFMGSKRKLLANLWDIASQFDFNTVTDLFSGSGVVSYMFKAHNKQVVSNDYMAMSATFSKAMVENQHITLSPTKAESLLQECPTDNFVERTFNGLYYSDSDNHLIDILRTNIRALENPYEHAIAMSALIRACMKKRPRGIFTYTGNRYDDGRKDLKKTLKEQFLEAVTAINMAVFDNHQVNRSMHGDAMALDIPHSDLVYMDPPYYSPLSDNEYVRRYHFVEGLARDWQGVQIQEDTKTKKFKNYPTPFSSKTGVYQAFNQLIQQYSDSILIISYSSNGLPSKDEMLDIMRRYKAHVEVIPVDYRYSFGNRHSARNPHNKVQEYFFVGW